MYKKMLAVVLALILSTCATARSGDLGPTEVMTCELARRVVAELDSDALIQAGGIVNKRISPEGKLTLYMYLEINREYRDIYFDWIVKNCKES